MAPRAVDRRGCRVRAWRSAGPLGRPGDAPRGTQRGTLTLAHCVRARAPPARRHVAAAIATGTADAQALLTALLQATVFCEAPETPGVMTAATPDGPVVPVFSSLGELVAARGAVSWFSTSGQELLGLLPAGHDLLLDPAGPNPLQLHPAALQAAVHVS